MKARPAGAAAATHFRVRHDKVDKVGKVSLRPGSRLYKIGLGRAHKGRCRTNWLPRLELAFHRICNRGYVFNAYACDMTEPSLGALLACRPLDRASLLGRELT